LTCAATNEGRFRVHELRVKYSLEPTLRDVFVEGKTDEEFYGWFLRTSGNTSCRVLRVSLVEIPFEMLESEGLPDNNRGRAILLARRFSETRCATSIVDRDFDDILGPEPPTESLLTTDYSSLEMYCFAQEPLQKFLSVVLRGFPLSAAEVLDLLTQPLLELAVLRCANQELGLCLSWVPFQRDCRDNATSIQLDRPRFLSRWTRTRPESELINTIEKYVQERISSGLIARALIRGHDFVELLRWLLGARSKSKQRLFPDSDALGRSLLGCLEHHALAQEEMFSRLIERTAVPQRIAG